MLPLRLLGGIVQRNCFYRGGFVDTKYYIKWHQRIEKWVIKYCGDIQARFDTKAEAQDWGTKNFPSHGHEEERVQVRSNSPRGARKGEWL